jgi:dienelactone hydrolase
LAVVFACGGSTPPPAVVDKLPPPDGALFKKGDVVAYAAKDSSGEIIARTHSTFLVSADENAQVMTRSQIAEVKAEVVTTLRPDLSPLAQKQLSSTEGRTEIRFKDRSVSLLNDAGAKEVAYARDDSMLIPSNDFMMLALALHRAQVKAGSTAQLRVLSPKTFKPDPVSVQVFSDADGHTVVELPDGRAILDAAGIIARFETRGGLVYAREDPPGDPPKVTVSPPTEASRYVRPQGADWNDREMAIDVDGGQLAGTLSEPKLRNERGTAPGVIFLSETGTQDRHGVSPTIDFGTWQILDRLADEGFAVLRIDGRPTPPELKARVDEARAMLGFMRTQPAVDPDRIFVIGLGYGAQVAAMLAAEEGLAGVILVSASYRAVPEPDMLKLLAKVDEDAAVFQGMKDFQVSWREDARPLVHALNRRQKKHAKLFAYENVDHLMKAEPGESSARRYADHNRRIDPRFLDDLVAWIKDHARAPTKR